MTIAPRARPTPDPDDRPMIPTTSTWKEHAHDLPSRGAAQRRPTSRTRSTTVMDSVLKMRKAPTKRKFETAAE